MWRSTMFLLCLIAALSATPLRQAEAASDLARSFAEFGGENAIQEIDGGVGDDSGATILSAGGYSFSPSAPIPLATPDRIAAHLLTSLYAPVSGDRQRADRITSVTARSLRRRACLQRFLF